MRTTIPLLFACLATAGCTEMNNERTADRADRTREEAGRDRTNGTAMEQRIIPSLTFQKNDAEQAMEFYVSLFSDSRILAVERWGKDGPGKEGMIMQATFMLKGQKFMCSDSPPVHAWDFTPAISNLVECAGDEEIERLFTALSEGGAAAMPLDNYGFSKRFGWVIDKFGVSWQLNLQE